MDASSIVVRLSGLGLWNRHLRKTSKPPTTN